MPSWNSRAALRMILSRTMSESFFGLGCACWVFFTVRFWKYGETHKTKRERGNRKYGDAFAWNLDYCPSYYIMSVCTVCN